MGKQTAAGPSQKPKWRHLGLEDLKLDFSRPGKKMHYGEKVVVDILINFSADTCMFLGHLIGPT